jgi:hypothetical protein
VPTQRLTKQPRSPSHQLPPPHSTHAHDATDQSTHLSTRGRVTVSEQRHANTTQPNSTPAPAQLNSNFLSTSSCASRARNLHSTTTAEKSSMALSPPNASRAGLRARQAAKRETTASTLIHAIVTVCTRWIRRMASGVAICSTETIKVSIIAPWNFSFRI